MCVLAGKEGVLRLERKLFFLEVGDAGASDPEEGERVGEKLLERLDAVGGFSAQQDGAAMRGGIADAEFVDAAFEGAGGIEGKLAGALDAIGGRRRLRNLNEFAAVGSNEQGPVALFVAGNLAEGNCSLVGSKMSSRPSRGWL